MLKLGFWLSNFPISSENILMIKFRFSAFPKLTLSILTIIIFLSSSLSAIADTPQHYTELELPPLPEIVLPEYVRYELDNGMVVYLVEDRDLPLVSGSAIIRTGSRFEPADKVGLARLTGSLMRNGGTKNHTVEELNLILEQDAASIETGINTTTGSASFNTLTEDLNSVLNLFAEVLREPVFDPNRLELAKNQINGGIARRNDDPQDVADREFDKLIYGATSPYGRTVEYETIDNISREDVVAFYEQYIRPENIILGIVGDFEIAQMKAKIEQAFGDWEVTTPPPPIRSTRRNSSQPKRYLSSRSPRTDSKQHFIGSY